MNVNRLAGIILCCMVISIFQGIDDRKSCLKTGCQSCVFASVFNEQTPYRYKSK